jgi:putative ABC transport system ATP-binding protein
VTGPVVRLTDVRREYAVGDTTTVALDGVSLSIEPGEFVAIVGPSGSGKSTLMNLVGCLDRPTAGTVEVAGEDVGRLGDDALTRLRGDAIGFVFQQFQLLPQTSALDNVAAPLLYRGERVKAARAKAAEVLAALGLGDRLEHDRTMLSGGQQQRVAIARAVVTEPALVLADEPTGALDSVSGAAVLELLRELHAGGTTVLVITHDRDLAASLPRQVVMRDGRVEHDSAADGPRDGTATTAAARRWVPLLAGGVR